MHRVLTVFGIALCFTSLTAFPADYYISPTGSDTTGDGSIGSPWQTIDKVNNTSLAQGDRVFFKGGATFSGTLTPKTGGAPGNPITFGSYDTGRATINAGDESAIIITNAYITIDGLNAVGSGRSINKRNGIRVKANNVIVKNVDVSGFKECGVEVFGSSNTRVEFVNAHDNGYAGIAAWGSGTWNDPAQYHTNQYYGNCKVYNNPGYPTEIDNHSGNGIVIAQVNGATIEYVEAYSNGWGMLNTAINGPCGIWCYQADNVTIQYCIAHDNKTQAGKLDGNGFDFDGGTRYSTIQYCLSYNNAGTGYLFCQFPDASAWEGNTVRYCISRNDGSQNWQAALVVAGVGTLQNAKVYNNTFYNDFGYAINFCSTCPGSRFYNNIFVTKNSTCTPNSGSGMSYQGNCYWKIGGGFSLDGYTDLSSWATAKSQETISGALVGINADPLLTNPGAAITLTDPAQLSTLTAFKLQAGSPCIDKGLGLQSLFGLNPGTRDFYGNSIPFGAAFDIGVHEMASNASAPTITVGPVGITVTAGQTATFSVTASGTAPLAYQWYKNNAVIGGATESSYITPATTLADNGAAFKVTVTNAYGAVTSSVATLTVNAAPTGTVVATGGTVTNYTDAGGTNWTAHIFKNVGSTSITFSVGGVVECLVVGGGGGGGYPDNDGGAAGGGGGGGLIYTNMTVSAGNYTVIVGEGGLCGTSRTNSSTAGTNSVFGVLVAFGGGRGANDFGSGDIPTAGGNGGSGGGGSGRGGGAGGTNTQTAAGGFGFNGGNGNHGANEYGGGGGGGAGSIGGNASGGGNGGNGGGGKTYDISGVSNSYAGGGGGGGGVFSGSGGTASAGGGAGGTGSSTPAVAGGVNTGGGGGGGSNKAGTRTAAANGGSGIVVVRYVAGGAMDPFETWRQANFTAEQLTNSAISGATADADGDGLNNQQEYWAGTNPTNALSCLVLSAPTNNIAADGKFLVRWQSVTGKYYTVMATTNLLSAFTNLFPTNIQATPDVNVYTDSVGNAAQRFYRVKLE